MTFREITINDYEQLVPFWKDNYFVSKMDSKDRFKVFLEKNKDLSIIAFEDNTIVGTILGSFDGRRGYIQKLVVDSNRRKKGVGKQLIKMVVEKLKKLGTIYIPISVESGLVPFYEEAGFIKTTQVPMKMEIN